MKKLFIVLSLVVIIGSCKTVIKDTSIKTPIEEPTVEQWLSYNGSKKMPHIVLVSGDEEYRSEEALPQLAKILSHHHGFKCTVLFAQNPARPGIVDPNYVNNIPGLEALATADLMILFTRFRALPDEQMLHIDNYLKSGKPLIGIRTATHAFNFDKAPFDSNYKHYGNYFKEDTEWKDGFGRLVMGEHWINHHGKHGHQSTKGLIAPTGKDHPITNGITDGDIWGPSDVYGVRLPLPGDANVIIQGQVIERTLAYDEDDPLLGMRPTDYQLPDLVIKKIDKGLAATLDQNDPMMPIAWTKSYQIPSGKKGTCFSATIGAATDMLSEGTRRLMVNATFWLLDKEVPQKANVDIVGTYTPTRFQFKKEGYWQEKNIRITDLE